MSEAAESESENVATSVLDLFPECDEPNIVFAPHVTPDAARLPSTASTGLGLFLRTAGVAEGSELLGRLLARSIGD